MLPFPNFESSILQRKMLSKGKDLSENSTSTRVESQRNGAWNVYFPSGTGNNEYKVTFQIKDGWVFYFHCPCPSLQGPMCEHSIAALFEIRTLYEQQQSDQNHASDEDDDERRPRRESRRSSRRNNEKDQKGKPTNIVDPTELLRDEKGQWELTQTEKEFECQVCLSSLKGPVLLPCQCHSICYACLEDLLAHKKKERDGKKSLHCPTCGEKSGLLRIKKIESVQINFGLRNIMKSYHSLRQTWEEEKSNLQIEIAEKKNAFQIESNKKETSTPQNQEKQQGDKRLKRRTPAPLKNPEDLKMQEEEPESNRLKKLKISTKN